MRYFAEESVREARKRYFEENGIAPDGGGSERIGRADFGPLTIYVPNFPARMAALRRHDLHHILLDADTSMRGEALVGGFEIAAGCGYFWVSWFLEPQTIVYGLFLNPRKTFMSFLKGRKSKSFFHGPFQEEWLNMTVGQLRDWSLAKGDMSAGVTDVLYFSFWVAVGLFELSVSLSILLSPFLGLYLLLKVFT
jgi:hypothetical protein